MTRALSNGTTTKTYCAICTEVICGPITREPLGRNDALVAVCMTCATEKPIARADDRGALLRTRASAKLAHPSRRTRQRVLQALGTDAERTRRAQRQRIQPFALVLDPRPGYVMHRVRRPRGFSFEDAPALIAGEPWANDASYLGVTNDWVLFDRPDEATARAARARQAFGVGKEAIDPMRILARYRTGGG
jgi:hypothetical protein